MLSIILGSVPLTHRIFFDVSGLCQWYAYLKNPSGIQRFSERILQSNPIATSSSVEFIASGPGAHEFYCVDIETIALLATPGRRSHAVARIRRHFADGMRLSRSHQARHDFRLKHLPYMALGWSGLSFLLEAQFGVRRLPVRRVEGITRGDVIVGLGDFWCHRGHVAALIQLKARTGATLVHMVHDLFAIEHPEWTHPYFGPIFKHALEDLAPHVDRWLVNSRFVSASLSKFLATRSIENPAIDVIPIGWNHLDTAARDEDRAVLDKHQLLAGSYLLHVGTVEPRKGVSILLRAMRRVAGKAGAWPILCVLIGREGWKSDEVRVETSKLGHGSVRWIRDVPDQDLPAIYRGARFSVVPSLGEGWGFPVQESLAQGVPCIASRAGAIPEVGGSLVRYVRPADVGELATAIEEWSTDDRMIAYARSAISQRFRSAPPFPTWDVAGEQVLNSAVSTLSLVCDETAIDGTGIR